MEKVLALILAGGRVDELGVLTLYRPKSILPFGGLYRVIDFPMSNLMHSGIGKVGILSQYRPFHLMEHIGSGASWDMVGRDRFASILPPFKAHRSSNWYRGTADAVYQNIEFINLHHPEYVLILSGDHIYDMDYRDLIAYHREKNADVTAAFTRVPREGAHRFGLARIEDGDERGGRVLDYVEKPEDPRYDWASLTIYLFKTDLLIRMLINNIRSDSHEFGRDIIPGLPGRYNFYGYKYNGYWGYTRTPEEYWQTSMDLLGENPKFNVESVRVVTNLAHREVRDKQPALVGTGASVENSLFYSGCIIDGTVMNSILFPGVRIAKGACVRDSIVFFDTVVESGAVIEKTILDVEVTVEANTRIGKAGEALTLVGRGTTIPGNIEISSGVTVNPNLTEEDFEDTWYGPGVLIS